MVVMLSVFACAAILVGALLLLHIKTLSTQINDLQLQVARMDLEAEAFNRSFCNGLKVTSLSSDTQTFRINAAGYERTYQVHTPANYDPSVRYPVIVNFDGISGSGARMELYSGINDLPVIAVYPDSLPGKAGFTAWQGAPYSLDGDYDIAFVRAMMQQLPSNYCVDGARTFAVGMSNGGGFAAVAACRLSDTFSAVASVAGAYYSSCDDASRQPSLLAIHSPSDRQVPFVGSSVRKLPHVTQWAESRAKDRQCQQFSLTTQADGTLRHDWIKCEDDSLVRLVVLQNSGHGWLLLPPDLQKATPNTASYIWEFFKEAVYSRS